MRISFLFTDRWFSKWQFMVYLSLLIVPLCFACGWRAIFCHVLPLLIDSMDKMMYEMNHILNWGCEIKWSYDPHSYECNFSYCVEKPEITEDHSFTWLYSLLSSQLQGTSFTTKELQGRFLHPITLLSLPIFHPVLCKTPLVCKPQISV